MISILIVDDEEGIREYLADALEDEGRTIVQAAFIFPPLFAA